MHKINLFLIKSRKIIHLILSHHHCFDVFAFTTVIFTNLWTSKELLSSFALIPRVKFKHGLY